MVARARRNLTSSKIKKGKEGEKNRPKVGLSDVEVRDLIAHDTEMCKLIKDGKRSRHPWKVVRKIKRVAGCGNNLAARIMSDLMR